MDLGISGRRAAVAGASSGLGFAAAQALVEAGCRVAICGRTRSRVEAAAERLGGDTVPLVIDVGTSTGGEAFVDASREALGGVDILVANSSGPPAGTFQETAIDAYPSALDLNLLSVVGMCKAAIPQMQENGFGRVVAITSITVRQPIGFLILSTTARAGVTGFLKSVALEVAGDGVTVNSLQPGYHATARLEQLPEEARDQMVASVPAGRLGDPTEFGRTVAFLCSTHASYITGAAIPVDGGAYGGVL